MFSSLGCRGDFTARQNDKKACRNHYDLKQALDTLTSLSYWKKCSALAARTAGWRPENKVLDLLCSRCYTSSGCDASLALIRGHFTYCIYNST
jgi:hypothetical protein